MIQGIIIWILSYVFTPILNNSELFDQQFLQNYGVGQVIDFCLSFQGNCKIIGYISLISSLISSQLGFCAPINFKSNFACIDCWWFYGELVEAIGSSVVEAVSFDLIFKSQRYLGSDCISIYGYFKDVIYISLISSHSSSQLGFCAPINFKSNFACIDCWWFYGELVESFGGLIKVGVIMDWFAQVVVYFKVIGEVFGSCLDNYKIIGCFGLISSHISSQLGFCAPIKFKSNFACIDCWWFYGELVESFGSSVVEMMVEDWNYKNHLFSENVCLSSYRLVCRLLL